MEEREHKLASLVIEDALTLATKALQDTIEAVYSSHAAMGRLRSGVTAREVVRKCEATASELLDEMVVKIEPIAATAEAFELIVIGMRHFEAVIQSHIPRLLDTVGDKSKSIEEAVGKLVNEMNNGLARKLEISRYRFDKVVEQHGKPADPVQILFPTEAKKGGRPLAEHWDSMWAATAAALHMGELMPKTQADIERFMLDWLENKGFHSNTSTVRPRARKLWQLIEADP
jgi:hypothetical protein